MVICLPGVVFLILMGIFYPLQTSLQKVTCSKEQSFQLRKLIRNYLTLLYSDSVAEWPGSCEANHRVSGCVECQFAKGVSLTLRIHLFIFHNVIPAFSNWACVYHKTYFPPLQKTQDTNSKPRLHQIEQITTTNSYLCTLIIKLKVDITWTLTKNLGPHPCTTSRTREQAEIPSIANSTFWVFPRQDLLRGNSKARQSRKASPPELLQKPPPAPGSAFSAAPHRFPQPLPVRCPQVSRSPQLQPEPRTRALTPPRPPREHRPRARRSAAPPQLRHPGSFWCAKEIWITGLGIRRKAPPTSRHPDISTFRHPDIPTPRHPDTPISRHRDLPAAPCPLGRAPRGPSRGRQSATGPRTLGPCPVPGAPCSVSSARSSVSSARVPYPCLELSVQCPVSGARCPVPVARCPVSGADCPVPSARCPVPSVRCPVSGAQCPLPGAQCPVSGAQCPVPGVQCPVPGAQCPVPTARCPVPSVRCPLPGARCPVSGGAAGAGGKRPGAAVEEPEAEGSALESPSGTSCRLNPGRGPVLPAGLRMDAQGGQCCGRCASSAWSKTLEFFQAQLFQWHWEVGR